MTTDNPTETTEEARERYVRAAHAMQTGVAFTMYSEPSQIEPKHLRVGVNCAMVEHSALVKLLLAKGVITETQYFASLADAMEEEVTRYRERLTALFGADITLG